jgi:hypothetical protein
MNGKNTAIAMASSWLIGLMLGMCLLSCGGNPNIKVNAAKVMPHVTQCVDDAMQTNGDRDALILAVSLCSLRVAEEILADQDGDIPVRATDGGLR